MNDVMDKSATEVSLGNVCAHLNAECLTAAKGMMQAIDACDPMAPPFKNLAAVFFHEYVRITTAYLFRKYELDRGVVHPDLENLRCRRFPFIDHHDVRGHLDGATKDLGRSVNPSIEEPASRRMVWKGIELFSRLKRRRDGLTLGLGWQQNAFRVKTLVRGLMAAGHAIKRPPPTGIRIENAEDQYRAINAVMEPVLSDLGFAANARPILELVRNYTAQYLSDRDTPVEFDVFLGGTLTLRNRLVAAAARTKSRRVVSICHGESDGVLDKPPTGIGEYGYATHVLSFGTRTGRLLEEGRFLHPVYPPAGGTRFVPSNGDMIRRVFDPSRPIGGLRNGCDTNFIYVPTAAMGFNGYGPYSDLPSVCYQQWWARLLELFPNARIKLHPNTDPRVLAAMPPGRVIADGWLDDYLDETEGFIFDYMATAFTVAAATDKPIVFLDIGLQNFTPSGFQAAKERSIYVDAREISDRDLSAAVMAQSEAAKSYRYVEEFCLDGTNRPRFQALLDLLADMPEAGNP